MKTREELKAILDEWIPKYIRQVVELRSGSRLSAERYNELMNLLITQGDDTIELAETVKQYMETLIADEEIAREEFTQSITQSLNQTTAKITDIANEAVDTAESAVASVNNYKAVIDNSVQQFKDSVNATVNNMSADIVAFKESVTQSIAASDAKVNTAVSTANKLTADMEAYRTELTQLTEQTFNDMQTALSQQVSTDVAAGVASLKDELITDINTTMTALEEQVMTIANTAEQSVNTAVQDIETYKANMDTRLDEALKEVEDSLSVAGDVIQDAAEIYAKIDEMNTLVNSYEDRIKAIEAYVEAGNANTLDGLDSTAFAKITDLANYLPLTGGTVSSLIANNLNVSIDGASDVTSRVMNSVRSIIQRVYADGSYRLYDMTNSKNIIYSTANGTTAFDGTASGNLPLTGGTVENSSFTPIKINRTDQYAEQVALQFSLMGTTLASIGATKDGTLYAYDSSNTAKGQILHTGNMADHVTPSAIGASATGHKHTKSEITDFPTTMTPTAHTHDDRYYTETEVNNLLANKQASLGFTPIQQGTGTGQLANVVKIGWSGSRLKATVDVTDMGNFVFDSQLTWNNVTGKPASMPASDVYSWAKASAKPTYTWSEITSKPTSFTPASHNQAASTITAGTFAGQVVAPAGTDYTTNRIRNSVFTTTDPGAGVSVSYANGSTIDVYE